MSLEYGHGQEHRVIKNSGASDRNLLAVTAEEPKRGLLPRTSPAFFVSIPIHLLTSAASLTDDSLNQFIIFNDTDFLGKKVCHSFL